jgi:hypothetical protein
MRDELENAALLVEIRRRLDRLAERRLRGDLADQHQEEYRRLCEEELRLLGDHRVRALARQGTCKVDEDQGLADIA